MLVKFTLDPTNLPSPMSSEELQLINELAEHQTYADSPELDDAFAEKLLPGKTLVELKDLISGNMTLEKAKQISEFKVNQIVAHLNKSVSFELPEEIVLRETQSQADSLVEEGSKHGASEEEMMARARTPVPKPKQNSRARGRVRFVTRREKRPFPFYVK